MFEGILATVIGGIILFYITRYLTSIYSKTKSKKDKLIEKDAAEKAKARPVPKPKALPHIWNVPHARNPNFTGREELLKELRKSLTSGKHSALTQAISGLGGVGKTQIALEYSYRHCGEYKVVWWLRSEETAILSGDFAELAEKLSLIGKEETDQGIKIQAARNWLEQNSGWLIIFDNAVIPEEVREYMPQALTGHVIITSRNPHWRGLAEPLEIKVFEPEEAVTFLLRRTGQKDSSAAGELADELGCLPLALEQAGAYAETTGKSIADYMDLFKKYRKELLAKPSKIAYYQATVATTWEISLEKVKEKCPAIAQLLEILSFFAPDGIPLEIFKQGKNFLPSSIRRVISNEFKLDEAISLLSRYSLIKVVEEYISIHRLVQAVIREKFNKSEIKKWNTIAVKFINALLPNDVEDISFWPIFFVLQKHALTVVDYSVKNGLFLEETCKIYSNIAGFLYFQGALKEAEKIYDRALPYCRKTLGGEHPELATLLNNIGILLQDKDDLQGALKNYEESLFIDIKHFGDYHPKIAIRLCNIGDLLREIGNYKKAKSYVEKSLAIDEKVYGKNHPNIASGLNLLGMILDELGDTKGAKDKFENALEIDKKHYGDLHPSISRDLNNLGCNYLKNGQFENAKIYLFVAHFIDDEIFGHNHPFVAKDASNLASVLEELGDYENALGYFEDAFNILNESFGEKDPKTILCRKSIYRLQERIKKESL